MKNRFDLLVFDWDGTLFDSIGWIVYSLQHAARECGIDVPDEQSSRSVIGLGLHEAVQMLYPGSPPELATRLATCYRANYNSQHTTLGLFDGIEAMLLALRDHGYKLAVATGKSRAGLDQALKVTAMADFFHATRCADETASKPSPLMLHQLMDQLEVQASRTLVIGDSRHDLLMAENAGVAVVGVACGANTRSELAQHQPLLCLDSTTELLTLLT
jgi:phosphoglycolate phosphatase